MRMTLDRELAEEAKALVVLAFRNGPLEALHAGRACPACDGKPEISHVSDDEVKAMMKAAVDTMYRLLWQREHDQAAYQQALRFGRRQTVQWDGPSLHTSPAGEDHQT